MFKTGIGYDVHCLVKGRKLVLGGVLIPHDKGLDGHSDADVVLHAICDALLGALGQGDIGEHFPNTDKRFHNIASIELLETVYLLVGKMGYVIENIDTVILAQEPKINSYKSAMKTAIAKVLQIDEGCVNIKATTTEGLGALGRKEGIAAYATVLLRKRRRKKM
jgi:2-C-methyl-D-erythritol 2,4-cyclodiphosphate synthase